MRKSKRAQRMSLVVYWDGRCELVVPIKNTPSQKHIDSFVRENIKLIEKRVKKLECNKNKTHLSHQGVPFEVVQENTRLLVNKILAKYPDYYNKIKTIRIKKYKAQWGSCSLSGCLSFNYKLSLLPVELCEYIVIHELAHIDHMNHSKLFWNNVLKLCTDYQQYKKELRSYLV